MSEDNHAGFAGAWETANLRYLPVRGSAQGQRLFLIVKAGHGQPTYGCNGKILAAFRLTQRPLPTNMTADGDVLASCAADGNPRTVFRSAAPVNRDSPRNALESSDWFDVAAVNDLDAEVALSGSEARWLRVVATQATDAPVVVREITVR